MTETTLMGLTKDLYNPSFKEHLMSQFQYMLYEIETDAKRTGKKVNWASIEMTITSDTFDTSTLAETSVEYQQHWRIQLLATKEGKS